MKLQSSKIPAAHRVICFLLAVYTFNFSIDSPDAHPDTVAEDLSVNDIESIFELVAEHFLGIENAVEERDERDHDDGGSFEFKKFFIAKISLAGPKSNQFVSPLYSPVDYTDCLEIRYLEINSPPPRA